MGNTGGWKTLKVLIPIWGYSLTKLRLILNLLTRGELHKGGRQGGLLSKVEEKIRRMTGEKETGGGDGGKA